MIYFDELPLSDDIKQALSELEIDYVFQPIFYPDGKTIYAREALMRPKSMTVLELIDKYTELDKLHVIEVATHFGAMQAHTLRGYTEKIAINSFPSECIFYEEAEAFRKYYGEDIRGKMVIEILEYPYMSKENWELKNWSIRFMDNTVSLDDYGVGINDMDMVDLLNPDVVKLDRTLICDIDKDEDKQKNCKETLSILHEKKKLVVAEGVETKEEFDYLVSIGIDLFQGYYLARPK